MSKKKESNQNKKFNSQPHRKTSVGFSKNSRPTNKHKRRAWKAYRGQGK